MEVAPGVALKDWVSDRVIIGVRDGGEVSVKDTVDDTLPVSDTMLVWDAVTDSTSVALETAEVVEKEEGKGEPESPALIDKVGEASWVKDGDGVRAEERLFSELREAELLGKFELESLGLTAEVGLSKREEDATAVVETKRLGEKFVDADSRRVRAAEVVELTRALVV